MDQDAKDKKISYLISLYTEGKLEEALLEGKKLSEYFPEEPFIQNIMGVANAANGSFKQAIKCYKEAINLNPKYIEAYNNLGVAYNDWKQHKLAIKFFLKAIELNPSYFEAYTNMGNAYKDNGDIEKAIVSYENAIRINPDSAEAYYNLGNVQHEELNLQTAKKNYDNALRINPNLSAAHYKLGRILNSEGNLGGALIRYQKAIKIKPDFCEAYYHLANTFFKKGKIELALTNYTEAIKINPNYSQAFINLGIAIKGVRFNKPLRDLDNVLARLLEFKNYTRPAGIVKPAISLLKSNPKTKKIFNGSCNDSTFKIISYLSKTPLLLKLMSVCPLPDLELENCLTTIRSFILLSISKINPTKEIIKFQTALALQCFTNESIYKQTEKEITALKNLEIYIKKNLSRGSQPNLVTLLCFASYKSLKEYEWLNLVSIPTALREVEIRQISEPQEEERLKLGITNLKKITDETSSIVRNQYEKFPYPRWVNLGIRLNPLTIPIIIKELNIRIFDYKINEISAPEILIAGCGTGQNSIDTASRFRNSNVTAIDLSLSSLAYAQRKTKELNIQNIKYMHADILDCWRMNKIFDIIESSGVLHHTEDPLNAWKVLSSCLKSGGLMKIGLYSQIARTEISKVRKEISKKNIGNSTKELKRFRDFLLNSEMGHHKFVQSFSDFYSLSEFRDLLFHVNEHSFTLPEIKNCLQKLGLKFCGFEAGTTAKNFMLHNNDENDLYDIDKWEKYELENPHAFSGMYQFWCQKVSPNSV